MNLDMTEVTAEHPTCVRGEGVIAGEPKAGRVHVYKLRRGEDPEDESDRYEDSYAENTTHYGFLIDGGRLITSSGMWHLRPLCWFCVPGPLRVISKGTGVVIRREGYWGIHQIGGPIEQKGRLAYIDGCSDSLLVHPPKIGDPCLNHLHFPPGIRQTMHTHPSLRCGIVARGSGRAVFPGGSLGLVKGMVWLLPTEGEHCFYTDSETMDVIAWHPDTDTGPSHDDHPMLNRTYVEHPAQGQEGHLHGADADLGRHSAKHVQQIRTDPESI